jgi:ribonucrease Y
METILLLLGGLLVGSGLSFGYFKFRKVDISKDKILEDARKEAKEKIKKADEEARELVKESEALSKKVRKEALEQENILLEREKAINKRSKMLDEKSEVLEKDKESLKRIKKQLEENRLKLKTELEKISNLTRDEAREKLLKEIDEDLLGYRAKKIREAESEIKEVSQEKAKEILVDTMQSIEADYVSETTTSVIKLTDEKVKGRIIGKDGRNIRAFEKVTGVDVVVDEAPNAIGVSSFDPLRREIARVALEKLIKDGRIHPGSIEDEVRKAKNEIAQEIKKNGMILAEEADWAGMDPGLLKLVGKMKYRSSYGQSLMDHTTEIIRIGSSIGSSLGADVDLIKKACLLHDVGKVLSHKIDQPHHHISGQIARKYNLPEKLVNAIEGHHLDIEPQSVEAVIVHIADAISGARPGARRDTYEAYIKRVEAIESVAREVGGDKLDEVFAIHAGREIRVIVKPKETTDDEITVMAKNIASEIQKSQTYPGTIQVTVIRENRAIEVAS